MKRFKGVLIALIVLVLIAAVYFGGVVTRSAALSVTSDPSGQKVYLEDQEVGETPYFSDQLDESNPVIRFGDFNQKVRLTAGALSVVNWTLGPSEIFSAGEVVWFSESSTGTELLVITKPVAEVFLAGESLGDSPLSKPLAEGEYDLEIRKEGYFTRKIRISVREGFRLNVSATLAVNPFPASPAVLTSPHSSLTVFSLSRSLPVLSADYAAWVQGAAFWAPRDESETEYDFFLTAEGKLYDAEGSEVSLTSLSRTTDTYVLGYLGTSSSLTSAASATLNSASARLYPAPPQVQIQETGIGYLRVRSGPGTGYGQIGEAPVGKKYTYLGEQGDWYKIDFNGNEGWISADYAKKL